MLLWLEEKKKTQRCLFNKQITSDRVGDYCLCDRNQKLQAAQTTPQQLTCTVYVYQLVISDGLCNASPACV